MIPRFPVYNVPCNASNIGITMHTLLHKPRAPGTHTPTHILGHTHVPALSICTSLIDVHMIVYVYMNISERVMYQLLDPFIDNIISNIPISNNDIF